jgi:hypothetical protein
MAEVPIGKVARVCIGRSFADTIQSSTAEPASSRQAMRDRFVRPSDSMLSSSLTGVSQNFPDHQYPSIVGRPILRSEERDGDIVVKDIMCGDEAAAARSMLQITYPVRRHLTIVENAQYL